MSALLRRISGVWMPVPAMRICAWIIRPKRQRVRLRPLRARLRRVRSSSIMLHSLVWDPGHFLENLRGTQLEHCSFF